MATFFLWHPADAVDTPEPLLGPPTLAIDTAASPALLSIHAGDYETVSFRFRASLAELEYTWIQGPYETDAHGQLDVAVDVPPDAFLHDAAADYVTDVVVTAVVGDEDWSIRGQATYLAWPDGPSGAAVLWSRAQMRALAPNGVLRAELRQGVEGESDRVMPNLSVAAGGAP